MKKTLLIICISILFSVLLFSYDLKPIKDFILEDTIKMGSNSIFYKNNETFIGVDKWSNTIISFNSKGKFISKTGGTGEGPGEFESIFSFSKSNNKYFVVDYKLYRLSILDNNLKYISSFYLKHRYEQTCIEFNDKIITLGHNFTNPFDQMNNYFIGSLYGKENNDYKFIKDIIPLNDFPNYGSIKNNLNSIKTTVGIPSIRSIKYKNGILILYNYLPGILYYDITTDKISNIEINFPEYLNPLEINFKIYNKLRKVSDYFSFQDIVFSPQFLFFDNLEKIFILQYKRPYQVRMKSENKSLYVIVILDENFNFISTHYTDLIIKSIYREKGKTYILFYEWYDYTNKNASEPDTNKFFIYEFRK